MRLRVKEHLLRLVLLTIAGVSFAANSGESSAKTVQPVNASINPGTTKQGHATNDKTKGTPDKDESFWVFLKGTQPDNALYLGMFTWHFNPESRAHDRWSNNLVGGLYNSIFVGTLLNSFSDRAFVVGVQRNLYTNQLSQNNQVNVGYRLGMMSGYDQRMSDFAKYLPVLPITELYIDYAYKNLGAELSYIGVVFTVKFFIRF
ncbi:hypothetical protein [Cysteiniphilum halobium]|uniref:hypothetical protein n=1 Tax=Cysteiniphilum halobium TaxID=2219059 RepID=UPI000E648CF3|nr:hypothetical protein [Cysteiniphilum halobium]